LKRPHSIYKSLVFGLFYIIISIDTFSQSENTNRLNYAKLYGLAMNQDIQSILKELDSIKVLSEEDNSFKLKFENRFKYAFDKTDYFNKCDTTLNPLNRIFQDYWRKSMLDNATNYDNYFEDRLLEFFMAEILKNKFSDIEIKRETLGAIYQDYIKSKGYLNKDYGKIGS
jgi:hypothetical protein